MTNYKVGVLRSRFLVCDRNQRVRRLLADILEQCGYDVAQTDDPEEFFRRLDEGWPDVAMAGNLPLEHGQSLVDRFLDMGLHVPLIVMVEDDGVDHALSMFEHGVFGYVRIPVERATLAAVAFRAVDHCRLLKRVRLLGHEGRDLRSLFQGLLNTCPTPAWALDPAGHVVDANTAAASALGRTVDSVRGRQYRDLVDPEAGDLFERAVEEVRRGAENVQFEKARGEAMFEIMLRPVYRDRVLVGFTLVETDVTARRRSEQELAQSEQRYRSVYQAARDAILLINRSDGRILDTNDAALRLYGYSREEMLGLSLEDIAAEPEQSMQDLRQGYEASPLRHHVRKDGSEFPVEASMSHFGHDGQAVTTAFIRDISNRKVVEEALREGARLYRAVVEDQTELICRFAPDFSLTFVNPACTKFFNRDEDDLLDTSFLSLVVAEERDNLVEWVRKVTPERPVMAVEQRTMRSDGAIRWMRWINRAIYDHKGHLRQFQCVGRDVSDRKAADEALEMANREKERLRLNLEATFRSIPDGIITVDSDMRVISTNSAVTPMCSIDRDNAPGRPVGDVMTCANSPCVSVLQQVLRTRRPVRGYEVQCSHDGGPERMLELNCSPLMDANMQFVGAVLVIKDITRIADLEKRLQERFGFRGMVGKSECMQEVYHLLEQLSPLDSTVLVRGESGTGKELVADALHYGGSRAACAMVKVNCSALSESLLESELFGHIRGAFTGAVRDKVGRIEAAQGGTLFLDEIGDISPLLQVKLLRFLEQKEYEKVGESKTRKADVRIIAATNVDLLAKVHEGAFREDLYYRLNVMPVYLPPLRERDGDMPLLVNHFLEAFGETFKKRFTGVSQEVLDLFMRYQWPGNIRELKHIMEHACILAPEGEIGLEYIRRDIIEDFSGIRESAPMRKRKPVNADAAAIVEALKKTGGNKAKAAKLLGIHRATLYRKMDQFGLEQ